jgi:hypothetical protein
MIDYFINGQFGNGTWMVLYIKDVKIDLINE